MATLATERSRPTSSATAANSSSCGAPRATSVATRRNAACSSASTRNSSPLNGAHLPGTIACPTQKRHHRRRHPLPHARSRCISVRAAGIARGRSRCAGTTAVQKGLSGPTGELNAAAHLGRRPAAKPARKPAPGGGHGHESDRNKDPPPCPRRSAEPTRDPAHRPAPPPKVVHARLYGL